METIGSQQLWSLLDGDQKANPTSNTKVRNGVGHRVHSYLELASKVAELQYRNRDYVLLYRGQGHDYKNQQGNSSLRPSMFRGLKRGSESAPSLNMRFDALRQAEELLVKIYPEKGFLGGDKLKKYQILRWSILQHYEVCATPLLDVTQSLRIAASFATDRGANEAFLYVLGVPNISGAITASAEAGIEVVRLSSVCPPEAIRPHIQEGYLLSEYPELNNYEQKQHYNNYEIDFGLRLVAKFRFNPRTFWKDDTFPSVQHEALYPEQDPLSQATSTIRELVTIR